MLRVADKALGAEPCSCCKRDDDYVAPGKPACDWDDAQAREALVDALARDAYAALAALDGRTLTAEVTQAAALVTTVVGQDLVQRDDDTFRIASYGTAKFVEAIEDAGAEANVKVQPPAAPEGKFAKDAFDIDLTNNTVRYLAGVLVVIRSSTAGSHGLRLASFGVRCSSCELRSQCTDGKDGRTIRVHPQEATPERARMRQRDPVWKARYMQPVRRLWRRSLSPASLDFEDKRGSPRLLGRPPHARREPNTTPVVTRIGPPRSAALGPPPLLTP